jgi:hypothetical protein
MVCSHKEPVFKIEYKETTEPCDIIRKNEDGTWSLIIKKLPQ